MRAGSTAGVPDALITTMSGLAASSFRICAVTLVSRGAKRSLATILIFRASANFSNSA